MAEFISGGLEEAWFTPGQRRSDAIAKRPVVAGRFESIDYYLSQRNSPALWGMGAIDRIDISRMRRVAQWQARVTEGKVTGRVAGKFGWRGQVQSLALFVSSACAGELGLSQSTATQANDPADPKYANVALDMSDQEVSELTQYVMSIPRPIETPVDGFTKSDLLEGEAAFGSIGCAVCHVSDLRPTSGMFSDLLLHDMGPELQSPFPAPVGELIDVPRSSGIALQANRFIASAVAGGYYGSPEQIDPPLAFPLAKPLKPQFPRGEISEERLQIVESWPWDALQREWRTPPLWGVADTAPYLHDGRAKTLKKAILWHGGEAKGSRDAFESLSIATQQKVIAFLSSLRSPMQTHSKARTH